MPLLGTIIISDYVFIISAQINDKIHYQFLASKLSHRNKKAAIKPNLDNKFTVIFR